MVHINLGGEITGRTREEDAEINEIAKGKVVKLEMEKESTKKSKSYLSENLMMDFVEEREEGLTKWG